MTLLSLLSCLTNLFEFFDNVTNMRGEGDPVDIINLDFQWLLTILHISDLVESWNHMAFQRCSKIDQCMTQRLKNSLL